MLAEAPPVGSREGSEGMSRTGLGVIAGILIGFGFGGMVGEHRGRADRDKWWLDRITGKEFPVEGSVLRQIPFGDSAVYCVWISKSVNGFTAQPIRCVEPRVITVCKFDDHAPPKEGDWVTISMTVAGDCSVADGSQNTPIIGKVAPPPAPKPAPRKDDCPYSDGCVTISSHTYWSVVARLKSNAKAMDRAKEELERLTKACSGGANEAHPCATWGDDCAFVDDLRQKPQP